MNFLRRLFHFLGGLPLAIFLISSAAVMVIAGTILESKTDSHRFASNITYGSPLFTLLLCGFFINILFSSLRRWPFQRKHIPFLITHLGLLMVLSGAIIKATFGVQGHMLVLEGGGSDRVTLPNSETLFVEKRHPSLPPLSLETVDKIAHGTEKRQVWFIDGMLSLNGLESIPVTTLSESATSIPVGSRVRFDDSHEYDLFAIKSPEWQATARQIYKQVLDDPSLRPALAWIQDESGLIHFFAFDCWSGVYGSELSSENLEAIVVYDKGFGGYTVPLTFPVGHTAETEIPPIQLFANAARKNGLDPQIELDAFFLTWNSQPEWLLTPNPPFKESTATLVRAIDWTLIPTEEYQASLWASILFDRIEEGIREGFSLQEIIRMAHWPLKAETRQELLQQVFTIASQLPEPKEVRVDPARLLSIYMRLYGITPAKTMTLESPLVIKHEPAPPLQKWEDNRPLITLKVEGEPTTLLFEPHGRGLKKPVKNGHYLMRYQPDSIGIPYRLRVRQARQINYPGTNQPYSYEADILLKEKASGREEKVTLSMNNVHESSDGYRFYLSSLSQDEEEGIKRVQIVVNYDPVKYLLTYPGAIFLVLGVLLLFLPSRKNPFRAC